MLLEDLMVQQDIPVLNAMTQQLTDGPLLVTCKLLEKELALLTLTAYCIVWVDMMETAF